MERDFEKELKEHELYQFLCRHEGCKVYWLSQDGSSETSATFKRSGTSVYYYWENGTYHRTDMSSDACRKHNSKNLLSDMGRIIRVEKCIDDKWLPVWTKADGFTDTDYQSFVYIRGRYYTFKEIEVMIDEVKSIKEKVASLKVY